jgi:hypothetical protein
MRRSIILAGLFALSVAVSARAEITGHYLETRTCQVYTGPCFANGEMGLAGKEAIMAWNIHDGQHNGVDLKGMNVVVALSCSTTLGHAGLNDAENLKSVIYVDQKADPAQREALVDFARKHAGKAGQYVVRIESESIQMSLNEAELQGKLQAGKDVAMTTRKARPTDCICSNEVAFYPPLAKVDTCAAGVTTIGEFNGSGLGARWSTPESRSAYMARFTY